MQTGRASPFATPPSTSILSLSFATRDASVFNPSLDPHGSHHRSVVIFVKLVLSLAAPRALDSRLPFPRAQLISSLPSSHSHLGPFPPPSALTRADAAYDYFGTRLATASADQKIKIWRRGADGSWEVEESWKVSPGLVRLSCVQRGPSLECRVRRHEDFFQSRLGTLASAGGEEQASLKTRQSRARAHASFFRSSGRLPRCSAFNR